MIEYIAEGKVSSVQFLKGQILFTLEIPTKRKAGWHVLTCRVTGELALRLKDNLQVGESVVVSGVTDSPRKPVPADSVMRVSR